jgi:hypothetical protein
VTIHVEGKFNRDHQLIGFSNTFEPKYRIGPTPPRFSVSAETVTLPWPSNNNHTDIVFHMADEPEMEAEAEEPGKPKRSKREENLRRIGIGIGIEVAPFQWTVCQLAVCVLVMAACMSAS